MRYAPRDAGSSLSVRQLLTVPEYRPAANPSEAYGALTECTSAAHCNCRQGGRAEGDLLRCTKLAAELEDKQSSPETLQKWQEGWKAESPPQDAKLAAGL